MLAIPPFIWPVNLDFIKLGYLEEVQLKPGDLPECTGGFSPAPALFSPFE